jgi:chemotaxis protein MotB
MTSTKLHQTKKTGPLQTAIRLLVVGLACLTALACGYSEDEWQAQLAKYGQLSTQHEATKEELAQAKARVAELEEQLKKLGFQLDETGATNERLNAALEEYKTRAAALERIKARFEKLRKKLEKLTQLGLKIEVRKNRMVISLPGDVLFASGKDELQDAGKDILRQVAEVIGGDAGLAERQYQVAGHTDDEPLRATKATFKDNWGLSLMRARSVLLYLVSPADTKGGGGNLKETNWSASGYGSTDPLVANDSDDNRMKNRRVELIMLPDVEEMLDLKSLI